MFSINHVEVNIENLLEQEVQNLGLKYNVIFKVKYFEGMKILI